MNLANKLTLSRIFIIPLFMFCLLYERLSSNLPTITYLRYLALFLFVVAAITDHIDGLIARRYNMITNFGKLFDPLADKLLITAAFVSFVELHIFPAWIVIVILSREFIITGLRGLGSTQGRIIHAVKWGKHKTLSQLVTIVVTLIYLCLRDTLHLTGQWEWLVNKGIDINYWSQLGLTVLISYCAVLAVLSGSVYLVRNIDLLKQKI